MVAPDVNATPLQSDVASAAATAEQAQGILTSNGADEHSVERYRRLPTGAHGLSREEIERDQRERLQRAMIELIAQRGYPALRILDLTQLAHVSRPTFYSLYTDKEELLLSAYEEIAGRTARAVIQAYDTDGAHDERLHMAMRAFAEFAAAEPDAMSLFLLGAFGAGPKMLERRNAMLESLERRIQSSRDRSSGEAPADLTVKVILGGIREVAAARLTRQRPSQLPQLADELAAWASSYPQHLPAELSSPPAGPQGNGSAARRLASSRPRHTDGRLPSGRHDLPREVVVKSQRERIVDATAAIVAEKGLANLTIPEIASRANVSHETFYEMYPTKQDAFLGAQKVGLRQALGVAVQAYEAAMPEWPSAIAAGLRALIDYLVSEPAHAHLSIVDAFGASPQTIEIRNEILTAFASYFSPGYDLARERIEVPAVAADAAVGGAWQVLHHYVENGRLAELPDAAPQLIYLLLTPFLGPQEATSAAIQGATADQASA